MPCWKLKRKRRKEKEHCVEENEKLDCFAFITKGVKIMCVRCIHECQDVYMSVEGFSLSHLSPFHHFNNCFWLLMA